MTLQDFENAFVLLLSGLAEKDSSVKWEDEYEGEVFITFLTLTPNETIVRQYWENRNKRWEDEYINGLLHGKRIEWYENGNKRREGEWVKGKRHGKSLGWYENGNKEWEEEWVNGKQHNKSLGWYENGNKAWEEEWENGKLIRIIK